MKEILGNQRASNTRLQMTLLGEASGSGRLCDRLGRNAVVQSFQCTESMGIGEVAAILQAEKEGGI